MAEGLPGAGRRHDSDRAGARVHDDVPAVAPTATVGDLRMAIDEWEIAAVVDDRRVVLGVVRAEVRNMPEETSIASVMQPAPPTVRPSIPLREWAVSALAVLGRVDEAEARADALCESLPRLLPEEFDPRAGASLANIPLIWSHAELARAMYMLDAAVTRRRRGAVGSRGDAPHPIMASPTREAPAASPTTRPRKLNADDTPPARREPTRSWRAADCGASTTRRTGGT